MVGAFFKLLVLVGENWINPPHPMSTKTTRRNFLKTAAVASIDMPTLIPASALGKNGSVAPSNRITEVQRINRFGNE